MLSGAFGWTPAEIDALLLDDLEAWIAQAKKWGFGGQYGRKT